MFVRRKRSAKRKRRRYDSKYWTQRFRALAKKRGRGARAKLDWAAYVAFRRRWNGRKGLVRRKLTPSRRRLYTVKTVRQFLREALRLTDSNKGLSTPANVASKQAVFTARELFRHVARTVRTPPRYGPVTRALRTEETLPLGKPFMRWVESVSPGLWKKLLRAIKKNAELNENSPLR